MKRQGKDIKAIRIFRFKTEGVRFYTDDRRTPEVFIKQQDKNNFVVIKFKKKCFRDMGDAKSANVLSLIFILDNRTISPLLEHKFGDCIEWKKNMDKSELIEFLTDKMHLPFSYVEKEYGGVVFDDSKDKLNEFKFNNWRIIMKDGSFDSAEIIELLKDVERYCGKFRKVCYGIVEVKKTLPSRILADYVPSLDSLRVKYQRVSNDFILSFLHELGHRYWFKFADDSFRREVYKKFMILSNSGRPAFKEDDILEFDSKMIVKVIEDMGNKVRAEMLTPPPRTRRFAPGVKVTFTNLNYESIRTINGREVSDGVFPSAYSRKSVEEFFAEVFSFYLTGKLSKEIKSWFDSIL